MNEFEELIITFGFKEGPLIIGILCFVVLLSNFTGGLIGNIILAMSSSPIVERSLLQRTSFRLAAASELSFIGYIVYYHTVLTPGIVMAQVIFWIYTVFAAPLLAMIGGQIGYLIYAKKIDRLKSKDYATEIEQESEVIDVDPDGTDADPDGMEADPVG